MGGLCPGKTGCDSHTECGVWSDGSYSSGGRAGCDHTAALPSHQARTRARNDELPWADILPRGTIAQHSSPFVTACQGPSPGASNRSYSCARTPASRRILVRSLIPHRRQYGENLATRSARASSTGICAEIAWNGSGPAPDWLSLRETTAVTSPPHRQRLDALPRGNPHLLELLKDSSPLVARLTRRSACPVSVLAGALHFDKRRLPDA